MRKARASAWLVNYIKEKGNAMNVTVRITIKG